MASQVRRELVVGNQLPGYCTRVLFVHRRAVRAEELLEDYR